MKLKIDMKSFLKIEFSNSFAVRFFFCSLSVHDRCECIKHIRSMVILQFTRNTAKELWFDEN